MMQLCSQVCKTKVICVVLGALLPTAAWAIEHELDGSLRLRYADLQESGNNGKMASASLNLRLESQWFASLASVLELSHVETALDDEYSDGVRLNGKPFVPDVQGSDIHQGFFDLAVSDARVRVGRQVINLENQRFVGSNGFWQNPQSFDALRLSHPLFSQSKFDYAYIGNANRIFGDDSGARLSPSDEGFEDLNGRRPAARLGDHQQHTHLLAAHFNEWDYSEIQAYALFIDNDDAPAFSSDTVGLQYGLKVKPSQFHYRMELEAAGQRQDVEGSHLTPYLRVVLALGYAATEWSVNSEYLGARDDRGFATPLGSLHEFNGWADVFTTTPSVGLHDSFLKFKWRSSPFKFDLRVHYFQSTSESVSLGHEFDADVFYEPSEHLQFLLRFAHFNAAENDVFFTEDSQSVFFNLSFTF